MWSAVLKCTNVLGGGVVSVLSKRYEGELCLWTGGSGLGFSWDHGVEGARCKEWTGNSDNSDHHKLCPPIPHRHHSH